VKYKNGNLYYENTKTGKTQYNYPTVTRAGNSTNLPEGWETYSFQGEDFYVDPQGESHWNKPTAEKKNKNTRQVVENELAPKEEMTPRPLPSQNGINKNKNKTNMNTPSPAGLFGNNNLEVENLKKNSVTGNATLKANMGSNATQRRRTNNQSKNTCPVCPVCPKPNQQSTEKMKKVLDQLKNIQSFVTTIKGSL
jgi:hypothetical protein